MKNLTKEEFQIYCLLYAANADFNITRQELIAVGSVVEPELFIRVYNRYEMDNDAKKKSVVDEHKSLFFSCPIEKENFLNDMKRVFFSQKGHEKMEESVCLFLNDILT